MNSTHSRLVCGVVYITNSHGRTTTNKFVNAFVSCQSMGLCHGYYTLIRARYQHLSSTAHGGGCSPFHLNPNKLLSSPSRHQE